MKKQTYIIFGKKDAKKVEFIQTKSIPSHYNYDLEKVFVDEFYSFSYFHEFAHVLQNKNGLLETIDRLKEFMLYMLFYTFILFSVFATIQFMNESIDIYSLLVQLLFVIYMFSAWLSVFHVVPEIHANWWANRLLKKYKNNTLTFDENMLFGFLEKDK